MKILTALFATLLLGSCSFYQMRLQQEWNDEILELKDIKQFNGNYSNSKLGGNVTGNEFMWSALVNEKDYSDSTDFITLTVLNNNEIELILKRPSGLFMNKAILNYKRVKNHFVLATKHRFVYSPFPIFQNWRFDKFKLGIREDNYSLEINKTYRSWLFFCFIPTPWVGSADGPPEIILYERRKTETNES